MNTKGWECNVIPDARWLAQDAQEAGYTLDSSPVNHRAESERDNHSRSRSQEKNRLNFAAGFLPRKMSSKELGLHFLPFIHSMLPISMHTYMFACLHVCEIKACISPFFVCISMCACAYTVNRLWVCLKGWGMSVCLYVWVCVSLVFPGLNSRVALGAESPGCNTLIVELFTLYSNPHHPHFGRVPLPLA